MTIDPPLENKPTQILCVDDEPNVLKSLRRLFRGSDYVIHLADGGAKGLEVLEKTNIDLIISDMRMPHMDGAEFLTKAAKKWPDRVRILLTGYADISSTIAAVNQGKIYSYCSKPWEDDELKALVAKAIEEKRLREERVELFAIINKQNDELQELNNHLEEKVEKRTEQLKLSFKKLNGAHKVLTKQYTDSIKVFAKTIEMRPGLGTGHSTYIAGKAKLVALKFCTSEEETKNILYAGLLLQIGKMSLPDSLIAKAYFLMNNKDRDCYLKHAIEGSTLLDDMPQLKETAYLIKHQFENYDGTGFPNGLAAKDIPLGSRILSVVRDYITFIEGSMTGKPMSVPDVQDRLIAKKGIFYDPGVVDYFIQVLKETTVETERPIVEMPWNKLEAGMEVAEIFYDDRMYLKDCYLNNKMIFDIGALKEQVGKRLVIKIRLGEKYV